MVGPVLGSERTRSGRLEGATACVLRTGLRSPLAIEFLTGRWPPVGGSWTSASSSTTRATSSRDRWLHRHLVDVADSCTGVDVLPDGVAQLREKGYDVTLHDVTVSPLEDAQFEVIVAGELIEHLGGPQALFDSVLRDARARWAFRRHDAQSVHASTEPGSICGAASPTASTMPCCSSPSNMAELGDRAGSRLSFRGGESG